MWNVKEPKKQEEAGLQGSKLRQNPAEGIKSRRELWRVRYFPKMFYTGKSLTKGGIFKLPGTSHSLNVQQRCIGNKVQSPGQCPESGKCRLSCKNMQNSGNDTKKLKQIKRDLDRTVSSTGR